MRTPGSEPGEPLPCWRWERVLEHICSCRAVVSSSLHGLVCADAYGIPNVWLDEFALEEGHFKFRDYFASQGRPFARIGSVGEMTEESLYRGGNTIDLDALQSAFPFG